MVGHDNLQRRSSFLPFPFLPVLLFLACLSRLGAERAILYTLVSSVSSSYLTSRIYGINMAPKRRAARRLTRSLICRPSSDRLNLQQTNANKPLMPPMLQQLTLLSRLRQRGLCGFWIPELPTSKIVPALHSRLAVRPDATMDGKCWRC